MRTYTKVQNKPKQINRMGDLTLKRWFVLVMQMFQPDSEKDIGGRRVVFKIYYGVVYVLCVRVCVRVCVCCVCVT